MTGLLLVHGAFYGPWCWDGFVDRLTGLGHEVRAVQLRGHDGSPGRIWHRVHDYVQDVSEAVSQLAEPPVLVGHSLGALVVAKFAELGPARAAVLLAPIPQAGSLGAVARLSIRHPLMMAKAHLTLRLRPFVGNPTLVRELFFTAETPQSLVEEVWEKSRDESYLAFLDTAVVRVCPERVRIPVLIMGAERDGFFTERELRRTAAAYRTRAEIVPGIGHDMMLDLGWRQVADRIATWIQETALASPARSTTPTTARSSWRRDPDPQIRSRTNLDRPEK